MKSWWGCRWGAWILTPCHCNHGHGLWICFQCGSSSVFRYMSFAPADCTNERENDKKWLSVTHTQNTISFGSHRGFPSSPMISTGPGVHILVMRRGMIHAVIQRRACSSLAYSFPRTPLLARVPAAHVARFGTLRTESLAVLRDPSLLCWGRSLRACAEFSSLPTLARRVSARRGRAAAPLA